MVSSLYSKVKEDKIRHPRNAPPQWCFGKRKLKCTNECTKVYMILGKVVVCCVPEVACGSGLNFAR